MVVGWACFFTLESLPLKTREKKDILTEMRPRIGFARQESGCGGRSRGSAFFLFCCQHKMSWRFRQLLDVRLTARLCAVCISGVLQS